jgi:sporulation protein YlmC with PRC-barrel domain
MPTKGERILADKILNRTVVSQTGKTFGSTDDLIFETNSGEIIYLVLKSPTPYAQTFDLEKTKDGQLKIPYNSVIAIGDFIVIAEEDIV